MCFDYLHIWYHVRVMDVYVNGGCSMKCYEQKIKLRMKNKKNGILTDFNAGYS